MNHHNETARRAALGLAPRPRNLNRRRRGWWPRMFAALGLVGAVLAIAARLPEL